MKTAQNPCTLKARVSLIINLQWKGENPDTSQGNCVLKKV